MDCYVNPGATTSSTWRSLVYSLSENFWPIMGHNTDQKSLGIYRGGWIDSNYDLDTTGWTRLTIVSHTNKTDYYINGNDTAVATINQSARGDFFTIGNHHNGSFPWGNLYGFRIYDGTYIPSELNDPLRGSPFNNEDTIFYKLEATFEPGPTIHEFTSSGTLELQEDCNVDILVVGGGGAGGNSLGGGGGAGGVVYTVNQTLLAGTYNIVVGHGGEGQAMVSGQGQGVLSNNGGDSYIEKIAGSSDVFYSSVTSSSVTISEASSLGQLEIVSGYIHGQYQSFKAFTGVYKVPGEYKWIVYYTATSNYKMALVSATETNGNVSIKTLGQGYSIPVHILK